MHRVSMDYINTILEEMIGWTGITGDAVQAVRYVLLVILAFILAWLAGWACRRFIIPLLLKITRKTDTRWDDVILGQPVLTSASRIVPAIVIWALLPLVFYEYPKVEELVGRLTAIYFTVMMARTVIVFIDSFKQLENGKRTSKQQYLYSICGVLKILIIFISAIVIIAIVINKNPATLFAGLGAASAILMLAFQDTIKGLVAGIRLTANDMLHVGDWISVPSAGANGTVEEISLTVVKVRNFDNTVVTFAPQMLVDGSFQNWQGMLEKPGRKQVRKLYFDFSSIKTVETDGENGARSSTNITQFRQHIEQWLRDNEKVVGELNPLVHQIDSLQASGYCLEFVFWLKAQDYATFEHDTSDIMEYIYAKAMEHGLTIYQPALTS